MVITKVDDPMDSLDWYLCGFWLFLEIRFTWVNVNHYWGY